MYDRLVKIRHRVGFVGAGYISSFHAAALRRVPDASLVGIYDIDEARCAKAAQTLGTRAFSSFEAFSDWGVDVIHVLTPPETHAQAALTALSMGAHVLVEKPLATDAGDARRIAAEACRRNLRVGVDHSLLYDPQIRRARELVRSGSLGQLVSVDILRSADYPPYEGGPLPVQYRSAGFPFRDLGVHQLYLFEALLGPIEDVHAEWWTIGGDPNLLFDEWLVQARCRDGYGRAHISFNVRPIQNIITLEGTKGVLRVDQMTMFSTRRAALPLPKTLERVFNAYGESVQAMAQVPQSTARFIGKRIRQFHGVQDFVADFYRCLDAGLPEPISAQQAIPIVEWTERVARAADADAASRAAAQPAPEREIPIVVTGAAGALGTAVLQRLRERGTPFKAFVRRNAASRIPQDVAVEIGDLGDPEAVDRAIQGARTVIHIGAATKGSWIAQRASTVVGTQNVVAACLRHGVQQLVYISSLSVVDWAGAREDQPIEERSPLEPHPEARGAYTQAKLQAELLVADAVAHKGLPAVILRPGQIFGGKLPLVNGAVARKVGKWHVVLGDGKLRLPLVYIEDVVDAIFAAMEKHLTGGEIVQLVDSSLPTQNEILKHALNGDGIVLRVPRRLLFTIGWTSEIVLGLLKRRSPLSRYRLASALARRSYSVQTAKTLLDWTPRVGVQAGMEASTRS
jgi:predicted dehydrogenase/nucleoside-diphosphate-sugar epimerase